MDYNLERELLELVMSSALDKETEEMVFKMLENKDDVVVLNGPKLHRPRKEDFAPRKRRQREKELRTIKREALAIALKAEEPGESKDGKPWKAAKTISKLHAERRNELDLDKPVRSTIKMADRKLVKLVELGDEEPEAPSNPPAALRARLIDLVNQLDKTKERLECVRATLDTPIERLLEELEESEYVTWNGDKYEAGPAGGLIDIINSILDLRSENSGLDYKIYDLTEEIENLYSEIINLPWTAGTVEVAALDDYLRTYNRSEKDRAMAARAEKLRSLRFLGNLTEEEEDFLFLYGEAMHYLDEDFIFDEAWKAYRFIQESTAPMTK